MSQNSISIIPLGQKITLKTKIVFSLNFRQVFDVHIEKFQSLTWHRFHTDRKKFTTCEVILFQNADFNSKRGSPFIYCVCSRFSQRAIYSTMVTKTDLWLGCVLGQTPVLRVGLKKSESIWNHVAKTACGSFILIRYLSRKLTLLVTEKLFLCQIMNFWRLFNE